MTGHLARHLEHYGIIAAQFSQQEISLEVLHGKWRIVKILNNSTF